MKLPQLVRDSAVGNSSEVVEIGRAAALSNPLYLHDQGECPPLELISFAEKRNCYVKELGYFMMKPDPREADSEMALMSFKPQAKKP